MTTWVGVPTRGDRDLRPLLRALASQGSDRVVVACNQPQAPPDVTAACAQAGALLVLAPQRGYASVRNALLQAAIGRTRLLAMLDDDELPDEGWLTSLQEVQRRTGAAAVLGPVLTRWPDGTAPAVRRADLPPRRREHPDGGEVPDGITGNCLMDLATVGALRFDAGLDVSGGEDSRFFAALRAGGGRLHWAASAVVREEPDPSRLSVRALCARSHRNGATAARVTGQRRARVLRANARRPAKAGLLLLGGVALRRGDLLLRAGWELSYVLGVLGLPLPALRRR